MTKEIVLTVVFALGILWYSVDIFRDWKREDQDGDESGVGRVSYKIKYKSLWILIFAYLISLQWTS